MHQKSERLSCTMTCTIPEYPTPMCVKAPRMFAAWWGEFRNARKIALASDVPEPTFSPYRRQPDGKPPVGVVSWKSLRGSVVKGAKQVTKAKNATGSSSLAHESTSATPSSTQRCIEDCSRVGAVSSFAHTKKRQSHACAGP